MERNNTDKIYYNKIEFEKALKLMETDPYQAREKFEEYISRYPEDYYTMSIYTSLLISLQEFDLAEKKLDELEIKIENDRNFAKETFKQYEIARSIFYSRIKLLSHKGQFKELYEYFLFHPSILETFNIDSLILYCHEQLGIPNTIKQIPESYITKQIVDYDEERMMEHIEKHLADYNIDEQRSACVFAPDFPIREVIEEVKKYIPSEKRLCQGLYDEHYFFEYEACGKVDRRTTNYLDVVCFRGTSDIITIYPSIRGEKMPHVDLNYMKENKSSDNPKVKKLSQREKFLRRYNKK